MKRSPERTDSRGDARVGIRESRGYDPEDTKMLKTI